MRRFLRRSFNILAAAVIAFAGLGNVSPAQAIGEACEIPFSKYDPVQYAENGTGTFIKASDGAMWTKRNPGSNPEVVRIANDGTRTAFAIPPSSGDIAVGSDGAIWFTSTTSGGPQLSRIANNGTITNTPLDANGLILRDTVLGPDGAFWGIGTESNTTYIVRTATNGTSVRYAASAVVGIGKLAVASDGNIWFVSGEENIGRLNVANGTITQFPWGKTGQSNFLRSFIAGPDGAVWYVSYDSETSDSYLGRMATNGTHTEFDPSGFKKPVEPSYLTSGDDGNIWYITNGAGIGRFSLTTHQAENFMMQTTIDHPGVGAIGAGTNTIWAAGVHNVYKLDLTSLPSLATPLDLATPEAWYIPNFTWGAVSGATSYDICRDGTVVGSGTTSFSDTTATEDYHFYTVIAKDGSGGRSAPSIGIETLVDRNAPTMEAPLLSNNPMLAGQTSKLTVRASDVNDVAAVHMKINGGDPIQLHHSPAPCTPTMCPGPIDEEMWEFNFPTDYVDCGLGCLEPVTFDQEGVHSIVLTATDSVGRKSAPQTISFTIGLVPPTTVTAAKTPTNTTPIINWSPVAGVDHYIIYRDGNPIPIGTSPSPTYTDTASVSDGTHTYTVATADGNGNFSTQSSPVNIVVDKTVPTVSGASVTPGTILFVGTLSISANASDALSGVASGEYYIDTDPGQGNGTSMTYNPSTGKITASRSVTNGAFSFGNHTVYIRTKDAAGNWSTTVSKTFFYI